MDLLQTLGADLVRYGASPESLTAQAEAFMRVRWVDLTTAAEQFLPQVQRFVAALGRLKSNLDRTLPILRQHPELGSLRGPFMRLSRAYQALAEPFYTDARPAQHQQLGAAWVPVLVVGGLAIGVVAISWAVVSYFDAEAAARESDVLLAQASIQQQELQARVDASRDGRTLQPSTLPPMPAPSSGWEMPKLPDGPGSDYTGALVGAAVLGGLLLLNQRKSS